MMFGKDGASQVIERAVTHVAVVTLPVGLRLVTPVFDDFGGVAVGTFDTF